MTADRIPFVRLKDQTRVKRLDVEEPPNETFDPVDVEPPRNSFGLGDDLRGGS